MHKGYTLNYFINFFKNIPDHRWTTGTFQEGNTVRHCALGHAKRRSGKTLDETSLDNQNYVRSAALADLLRGNVVAINDGIGAYETLGSTPCGRILRALRNRKRYGKILK